MTINQIPAHISVASARLPQTYENATLALANCASIDECQEWADKAAALASYAKQAADEQLEKMAIRIRARAIRRCGELLKQFDGRPSNAEKQSDAADTLISQREAAQEAGLSRRQQVTAVRVANVPQETFAREVESEKPPTISQLATMGIKPRPLVDLKGRDPQEFNRAMHYVGVIGAYARDLRGMAHDSVLPILIDREREALRKLIGEIDAVHDMIATRI